MQLTITGYSTALFSTWYFLEELGILFDAGDGVTAALLQKSRKIKYVFISHADRDHLAGLLQLNQLNARTGFPARLNDSNPLATNYTCERPGCESDNAIGAVRA